MPRELAHFLRKPGGGCRIGVVPWSISSFTARNPAHQRALDNSQSSALAIILVEHNWLPVSKHSGLEGGHLNIWLKPNSQKLPEGSCSRLDQVNTRSEGAGNLHERRPAESYNEPQGGAFMSRKRKPKGEQAASAEGAPQLKIAKTGKPPRESAGEVYQIKITLNDVKPPIWRRVLTRDCTLTDLHQIIQASMGWFDGHLHVFEIAGQQFGIPEQWQEGLSPSEVASSRRVKLNQLLKNGSKKLRYVYDMGDGWEHTILIEKTIPAEPGTQYPRCTAGARACPPEDCGGPWGYGDFLDAIADPKHERHEELLEWLDRPFDPDAFDLAETNELLEQLA
jgi:hypothetical protein